MKRDTVCRLCSSCCPVEVILEDNRLIAAVRKSSPLGERASCPKLKAAADIVYSPDRLKAPLVKEKRDGIFKEASWDDALDRVVDRFHYFKKTYGAESICWLRGMAADWGAPWDYVNRLMNLFGSPNTIGNGSVCHVAREMAHVLTYGAMTASDQKNSGCIIVWGKNDRDTNPAAFEGIRHAKDRGAKLIVVDPIRTELAAMADIWLQIKPGCDGLLAMSMIHEIISNGLYDRDFVEKWTVGFDSLRKAAAKYPAEAVGRGIWLAPDAIQAAARLYATQRPASIIEGNGLDMQLNIFDNTRAVCFLRGLTGNLDRPGGDLIPQPIPVRNIQMKDRLPEDVKSITCDYPLFNEFHETWGRHVQSCVIDAILDETPYPVKMLVVQSANPVVTMTDSRRVMRVLERLEFLVVIDPFMTRTAQFAHVVLPATSCFEKTQLNRAFLRNNPVVLQNQVMDCVGDSWPDWKITFELARRLGLEEEFPWQSAEEAIDYQLAPAGITVDMLRENPGGIRVEDIAYEKYTTRGFDTPSGKMEFYSRTLEKHGYPPVPSFDHDAQNQISFYEQRDEFPMLGISGARSRCFTHSQFKFVPSLLNHEKECAIDIHPADAREKGISDGDRVRVETPRGHITMKARISDVVHPEAIRIAWGWGEFSSDYNLNNLTDDDRRNRVTGTPSNRSFMCRITKVTS
ncbi:MAG: molybdopterin-dependent oxidoreductase [Deltaproteobacteria bacterium]|nr:molybdopterin-dependent oxidoreductase [Deltaproteobacteria bacterium]